MTRIRHPDRSGLHIRVVLDGDVVLGPGRADLLEGVRRHGSIAAAGRAMGMSYKRAWDLVDAMNTRFHAPVVDAARGGNAGGGARLTATGEAALASYRAIEAAAAREADDALSSLARLLRQPGAPHEPPFED